MYYGRLSGGLAHRDTADTGKVPGEQVVVLLEYIRWACHTVIS